MFFVLNLIADSVNLKMKNHTAKTKRFLFTGIFFIFLFSTQAQNWQWAIKGESSRNITSDASAIDRNGNSLIAGTFSDSISFGTTTLTNPGLRSVYVANFDVNSNLIWAKIVAYDSSLSVNEIIVYPSGDFSITGQFYDTITVGQSPSLQLTSAGNQDLYLARFDSLGNFLWAKSIGGTGIDFAGGISADNLENTFLSGDLHITSFPYSGSKIFLNKYDISGNLIWSQVEPAFGNNHFSSAIKCDDFGNCYVVGEFFNHIEFNSGDSIDAGNVELNGFVIKFDPLGNYVWGKTIGAASGYCGNQSIEIDQSGNCYMSGFYHGTISFGTIALTSAPSSSYEVFIAKCDSDGNFIWATSTSGSSINGGLSINDFGAIYICGNFSQTIGIGPTVLTSQGEMDCFIAKLNSSGNFEWAIEYGGSQNDLVNGIITNQSELYLCGTFTGEMNFGSALTLYGNDTITSKSYLAKLDITSDIFQAEHLQNVKVFPCPAITTIKVTTEYSGKCSTVIFDVSGKEIMHQSTTDFINIEKLTPGIYILKLFNGSQYAGSTRFIKN